MSMDGGASFPRNVMAVGVGLILIRDSVFSNAVGGSIEDDSTLLGYTGTGM